jgi:hypothetical protein
MFRRTTGRCVLAGAVLLALGVTVASTAAFGADHRDGPRVTNNANLIGGLDLNDLYVFTSPANPDNTVMIMTLGGAAVGIIAPPFFFPGAIYEFRISNDGNPTTDELVVQVVFSSPDQFLRQSYVVVGLDLDTGRSQFLAQGVTGKQVNLIGGGKVQAGLFDDPFFFDLLAFNKFKAAAEAGAPLAQRVAPFLPPNIPNNFFANFNVLAIVVETSRHRLQAGFGKPNISVWIRSLVQTPNGPVQFDRMGRPAINTAVGFEQPLSGLPNIQDMFNSLKPSDDPSLIPAAAQRINLAFGLAPDKALALAGMLLPDVTTFNTTNTSGFLNGRRLADDVIDAELSLLTGGALTSDRVVNDSVFSNKFPYLGPPLPRAATNGAIRSLNAAKIPTP